MDEEFITLIKQQKHLYDRNDPNYKNKTMRKETWEEIGYKLCIEPDSARKKWKTLLSQYSRRKKNVNEQINSTKTFWKCQELMNFLDDFDCGIKSEDDDSAADLCMGDYLNFSPKPIEVPGKKKLTQDELIREPYKEIAELMQIVKASFSEPTSVGTFLHSLALLIESADLSFRNMCNLQVDLLTAVHNAIRRQNALQPDL